ncbi:hypothetical protein [Candidatus Harpocratesius sp.]
MKPERSPNILILDLPDLIYTEKRLCEFVIPNSNIFVSSYIEEAKEIIQTKPIDIILMDLFTDHEQEKMVDSFLAKVKREKDNTKIIGTSGTFISHKKAEFLDHILMKPFSLKDLQIALSKFD